MNKKNIDIEGLLYVRFKLLSRALRDVLCSVRFRFALNDAIKYRRGVGTQQRGVIISRGICVLAVDQFSVMRDHKHYTHTHTHTQYTLQTTTTGSCQRDIGHSGKDVNFT